MQQKAILLHHPSAKVELKDPRDPDVKFPDAASPDSIQAAYEDNCRERDRAGIPLLPMPGITDPIRAVLTAATKEEEWCVGCGLPTRLHRSLVGDIWIGCSGALTKQTPPRNPERWNDPRPGVTCEVRKALLTACGPDMEIHCAHYTHDELLTIAHALAMAAVSAYIRELGK